MTKGCVMTLTQGHISKVKVIVYTWHKFVFGLIPFTSNFDGNDTSHNCCPWPRGCCCCGGICCLLTTLVYFCATTTWLSIKFERNQVLHIPQFVFFGPVSPKMATLASYLLTHFDFSSCIFGTYVSTKTATMACHLLTHLWFSLCNYYTNFLQICKCHSHSRQLLFLDHWCIHIFSVKLFLWQCVLLLHIVLL